MKVLLTFLFIISSVYSSAIHEYAPALQAPLHAEAPIQQVATEVHEAPATVSKVAAVTTGVSSQSRAQDNQGNYAFAYKEDHAEGGTFRKEEGNSLGQVIGSYGLRDADGRVRIVNYVADDLHGFRASIATNEPGTAAQPAAATSISSPHAPAVVQDIHEAPSVQVAEQLVAPHSAPVVAEQAIVSPQPQLVAHQPQLVAHQPQVVAAQIPAQLISNYAASIYGPSLLTDNVLFKTVPREVVSAVPATTIPAALQTSDGLGYYEPTQYYSGYGGLGYLGGTNVGQFGYQLTYRKKKK